MESPPPPAEPPPSTPTPKKRKYSAETRQRVVDCAREGGDWKALALALKVPPGNAKTWTRRYAEGPDDTARKRGGSEKILTADHVEFVCSELNKNNKLTLVELSSMVRSTFHIPCSVSTASRGLDGSCCTLKKTHVQPQYMNTEANKIKRRDFLRKLLEYKSRGYKIYYVDKTNFNLWTARTEGRSPKGERCPHEKVSGGGRNMHVIACISEGGLVYYENRFGSNRAPGVNQLISNMLRTVRDEHRQPLNRVIVVLDNAPCHTDVESVFEQGEFAAADVLRLDPYSPQLNPIESVFSVFKAKVKSYFAREAKNVRNNPPEVTKVAHQSAYLERASNMFIADASSATNCVLFELHSGFTLMSSNSKTCRSK